MVQVVERPHNKHVSSVFIRHCQKENTIFVCEEENVELITVELPGVVVHSMLKQPPEPYRLPALGQRNKPHIVIDGHSGDTPEQTATENLWINGRTETACHSYITRNYRTHLTVQYRRRDTTRWDWWNN